jgi:signal transduction histidine kinase
MKDKLVNGSIVTGASICALLAVQALFFCLQIGQAEERLSSIRSLLQKEAIVSNPYLMSNTLADLGALNAISCVRITMSHPTRQVFIDDTFRIGCNSPPIFLDSYPVSGEFSSANGTRWTIAFRSLNRGSFILFLWITRVLAVLVSMLLFRIHKQRVVRALEIERLKSEHIKEFGRLAKQVAHDIRSPLTAMKLILPGLGQEGSAECRSLSTAIDRISRIANDLLEFSKPSMGQTAAVKLVNLETANAEKVASLIFEIAAEKRAQLGEQSPIKILTDCLHAGEFEVKICATAFCRMLSNLVGNSIEAIFESGRISISLREYKREIAIIISDDGKGMAENVVLHYGEEGFSSDKNHQGSGFGLGAAHAKSCVAQWGGRLSVQSKLGMGCMITISLPRFDNGQTINVKSTTI